MKQIVSGVSLPRDGLLFNDELKQTAYTRTFRSPPTRPPTCAHVRVRTLTNIPTHTPSNTHTHTDEGRVINAKRRPREPKQKGPRPCATNAHSTSCTSRRPQKIVKEVCPRSKSALFAGSQHENTRDGGVEAVSIEQRRKAKRSSSSQKKHRIFVTCIDPYL